jgi:hypothetical protein
MASRRRGKKDPKEPYRSNFEALVANQIGEERFSYETMKMEYTIPESKHKYTPDFPMSNGIILEVKGRLEPKDRKKMVLVRDQNPDMDIRFVFMKAQNKITKNSKTTYAMWAEKNGFRYCEGPNIPKEWLKDAKI